MRVFFIIYTFFFVMCEAAAQQYADCVSAKEICKKQTIHFRNPKGEGADRSEADFIACFMNGTNFGQAEENCNWVKFEIAQAGTILFTITPDNQNDDIDFVVYKLPGNGSCAQKQIIRCMAAACPGATGLRAGELDTSEDAGCADEGDNTWLAPIRAAKGDKYAVLISNVSQPAGYAISFSGTALLPCEKPEKKEKPKKDPPPIAAIKEDPKQDVRETPTTTPSEKRPTTTAKTVKPDTIGGRAVELSETVKVKSRKIKIKVWDSQLEDGDIVSIYLNDKKVVDRLYLRVKPQEFEFELPPGRTEHYLTLYADSFGKSEPNTANVLIYDGAKEYTLNLVSGRKKQDSIKIISE